jgi:hypothetical protein
MIREKSRILLILGFAAKDTKKSIKTCPAKK